MSLVRMTKLTDIIDFFTMNYEEKKYVWRNHKKIVFLFEGVLKYVCG